jgi:DNA mismatch repair protein MutL
MDAPTMTSPRIHRLPLRLQRLIAAGEVVERPASVVRELLENSLDAGARRITIDIDGGGIRRIVVVDDGCGIHPEDLPLAVERYATSKVTDPQELFHPATLGFRGEALAAIRAAARRLRIVSRLSGADAAASLLCVQGEPPRLEISSSAPGTRVEVEGLFDHLPARRAFLRPPAQEAAACLEVVQAYALLWPEVAFLARRDGRVVLSTPGTGDARAAAAAVWGQLAVELLPLAYEEGETVIGGLLSPPHLLRRDASRLVIGVRGRPVRCRDLEEALEEAYLPYLVAQLRGRKPQGVLHLSLPPEAVDCNVHPGKLEVRLRHPQQVRAAVCAAVAAAMGAAAPPASAALPSSPTAASVHAETGNLPPPASQEERQLPLGHGRTAPGAPRLPLPATLPRLTPLVQALGWLIICQAEGSGSLYLVDQHAAHERVVYERLLSSLAAGDPLGQPLLAPVVVELSPAEMAQARRREAELVLSGIEAEPLDERSYIVRSLPPGMLARHSPEEAARLLLLGRAPGADREAAALVACHTSIRRGDPLSLPEMEALLRDLAETSHPHHCPHGRPTVVELEGDQIIALFGRNYRS